jgi:hypothetical protein
MAAIVSSLGISGWNGNALSLAIRIIIRRKADEGVSPISANTAAAARFVS